MTSMGVRLGLAAVLATIGVVTASPAGAATTPPIVSTPGGWVGLTSTNVYAGSRVNLHGSTAVVGSCQRKVVIQQHVGGTWSRTVATGMTTTRGFFSLPVPTPTPAPAGTFGTYGFRAVVAAGCGKPQWVSPGLQLNILLPWNMNDPGYSNHVPAGTSPAYVSGWVYNVSGCQLTVTLQRATSVGWVNVSSAPVNPRGDYTFAEPTARAGTVNYRVTAPNACNHSAQHTSTFAVTIS
jgi:hypothetical protein